jgi:hypothetical protein
LVDLVPRAEGGSISTTNAAQDKLEDFVLESLRSGKSRADITKVLEAAEWTSDQIRSALRAYAEVEFPIPVPRPRPPLSSRDFFVYALLFTTLYLTAYYLGKLFFEIINLKYPDPAEKAVAFRDPHESLRWAIAWLCVAAPTFLGMSFRLDRTTREQPGRRLSPVRRLLTYLTLFIASVSFIGDLATLIFCFLNGELTTRVLLKIVVVAVIAGNTFWYYFADLRREERAV